MYAVGMYRVFITTALACLFGCSHLSKSDDETIRRALTAADAERSITVAPNGSFDIELQSNPTTGYEWSLSVEPPEVVATKSKQYTADASGRVGVGGVTRWSLNARMVGSATLTFMYSRPWEKGVSPTRIVTFQIDVR